jgi:hypothetical protein
MNPYQDPNHKRYIEEGGCPKIHITKTWCNLDAGHSGKHFAPRRRHNNSETGLFWGNEASQNYMKDA